MKCSGMPARRAPMRRGKPMRRTRFAAPDPAVVVAQLRRTGFAATDPATTKPRRAQNTGPTVKVRDLVHIRSGDRCEWPGCPNRRAEVHHRLNRKDGGRHGEMRFRINQAAWLVDACSDHHRYVTSPVGAAMVEAKASGWMLVEGQDARLVPILTRHAPGPVLLDNVGGWALVAA